MNPTLIRVRERLLLGQLSKVSYDLEILRQKLIEANQNPLVECDPDGAIELLKDAVIVEDAIKAAHRALERGINHVIAITTPAPGDWRDE